MSAYKQFNMMANVQLRSISSKASLRTKNEDVELRGTFIPSRKVDMPTMIWLPEMTEKAENFETFFNRADNKIRDVRNVWLLNYRNTGRSDHHESFDLHDMADDIVRFMDQNKITMATIGGHGFGAKVATAAASNNLERFTGVINLDGGPLDHTYYEAQHELKEVVSVCKKIQDAKVEHQKAVKMIDDHIQCPKWRQIMKQNLENKSPAEFNFNVDQLHHDQKRAHPETTKWTAANGMWPGEALAIFGESSRWVHLSTNTLQFYNVFPRLQGQFGQRLLTWGTPEETESPLTHWLHEEPSSDVWMLSQKIWRWLKFHDGKHVMLADKTEAGWYYVPERGACAETQTP
jgi:pimeloyl-ACP methyl ester carboxylesterase